MTEQEAKEILKPADAEYIEFVGNVQDVIYGCDSVAQASEMLELLIKAYEPTRIEVTEIPQEDEYVRMPGLDNRLHYKPF